MDPYLLSKADFLYDLMKWWPVLELVCFLLFISLAFVVVISISGMCLLGEVNVGGVPCLLWETVHWLAPACLCLSLALNHSPAGGDFCLIDSLDCHKYPGYSGNLSFLHKSCVLWLELF